ncbi:MAG: DUF4190 domain-containing protein [Candidatus Thermoplasmatota archaeon]|nr:DUF4190 domain-containing protein [Candidatus Thermoplasmatota archaeon]
MMAAGRKVKHAGGGSSVTRRTYGLAIASLVVSLAGIFVPYAPLVGIILGFVALSRIKEAPLRYEGRGLAKAGIAIGFVVIGLKVLFFLIYLVLALFLLSLPFFFIFSMS